FLYDGHGVEGESAEVTTEAAFEDGRWKLIDTTVAVPARELTLASKEIRFGDGVKAAGTVDVAAPLERLHDKLPALADEGVTGAVKLSADLHLADEIVIGLSARSPALTIAGEDWGEVRLNAPGVRLGEVVRLPEFKIDIGDSITVNGDAEIGDTIRAHLEGGGPDFGWIARFLPEVDGEKPYSFNVDLAGPRPGTQGRFSGSGEVGVAHIGFEDGAIDGAHLVAREISFEWRDGNLIDLRTDATLDVDSARRHTTHARGIRMRNLSRGSILADGSGAGHRLHLLTKIETLHIEKRKLDGLTLDGVGALRHLDFAHGKAVQFDGKLLFDRIPGAVLDWTDGSAEYSYHSHMLDVRNLNANLQGGKLAGSAHFDFRKKQIPWRIRLEPTDLVIDKDFASVLSYVLPVLRVKGGESSVTGRASGLVKLEGRGFTFDDIEKNLRGNGHLRVRDTEVKGSLLLPLLSLRLVRLLGRKPFKIPDSTVKWNVKDGVVTTEPLKIASAPFGVRLGGSVTVRGELDYIFHPGVLVVPIRVSGHWDDVSVRPTTRELLPVKWPWDK
ncbi:MAG: AsmA family protein, partial [Planctomycetota bacterium]